MSNKKPRWDRDKLLNAIKSNGGEFEYNPLAYRNSSLNNVVKRAKDYGYVTTKRVRCDSVEVKMVENIKYAVLTTFRTQHEKDLGFPPRHLGHTGAENSMYEWWTEEPREVAEMTLNEANGIVSNLQYNSPRVVTYTRAMMVLKKQKGA